MSQLFDYQERLIVSPVLLANDVDDDYDDFDNNDNDDANENDSSDSDERPTSNSNVHLLDVRVESSIRLRSSFATQFFQDWRRTTVLDGSSSSISVTRIQVRVRNIASTSFPTSPLDTVPPIGRRKRQQQQQQQKRRQQAHNNSNCNGLDDDYDDYHHDNNKDTVDDHNFFTSGPSGLSVSVWFIAEPAPAVGAENRTTTSNFNNVETIGKLAEPQFYSVLRQLIHRRIILAPLSSLDDTKRRTLHPPLLEWMGRASPSSFRLSVTLPMEGSSSIISAEGIQAFVSGAGTAAAAAAVDDTASPFVGWPCRFEAGFLATTSATAWSETLLGSSATAGSSGRPRGLWWDVQLLPKQLQQNNNNNNNNLQQQKQAEDEVHISAGLFYSAELLASSVSSEEEDTGKDKNNQNQTTTVSNRATPAVAESAVILLGDVLPTRGSDPDSFVPCPFANRVDIISPLSTTTTTKTTSRTNKRRRSYQTVVQVVLPSSPPNGDYYEAEILLACGSTNNNNNTNSAIVTANNNLLGRLSEKTGLAVPCIQLNRRQRRRRLKRRQTKTQNEAFDSTSSSLMQTEEEREAEEQLLPLVPPPRHSVRMHIDRSYGQAYRGQFVTSLSSSFSLKNNNNNAMTEGEDSEVCSLQGEGTCSLAEGVGTTITTTTTVRVRQWIPPVLQPIWQSLTFDTATTTVTVTKSLLPPTSTETTKTTSSSSWNVLDPDWMVAGHSQLVEPLGRRPDVLTIDILSDGMTLLQYEYNVTMAVAAAVESHNNVVVVTTHSNVQVSFDYDPVFLPFETFPADPNRGFEIPSVQATFTTSSSSKLTRDQEKLNLHFEPNQFAGSFGSPTLSVTLYSNAVLLLSPVPDMSMPFNVLSLTCTLYAFVIGSILNHVVRKASERVKHTLDPSSKPPSKLKVMKERFKEKMQKLLKLRKKHEVESQGPGNDGGDDERKDQDVSKSVT